MGRFLGVCSLLAVFAILLISAKSAQLCSDSEYFLPSNLSCVSQCPRMYYASSQGTQQICSPQQPLAAWVHPTVEPRTFILIFQGTPVPFQDIAELKRRMKVTLNSSAETFSENSTISSAYFLTQDKTIVQFSISAERIPPGTTLKLLFPAFTLDPTRKSYIPKNPTFSSLPFAELSDTQTSQLSSLRKLDQALEYSWILITCLNPYAFLYMNSKLYRETFEMLKRANIEYDAFATQFFRENQYKISGLKSPNLFPIVLEGDPVTSGWVPSKENQQPSDADRIQDLRLAVSSIIYKNDAFPLFLDNYGTQITIFLIITAVIIFIELLNLLVVSRKYNSHSLSKLFKVFQTIRKFFKYNLLIASVIGSFQSLIFYFMVQMQVWAWNENAVGSDETNIKLNFWFAIGTLVICGVAFPLWLLYNIVTIYRAKIQEKIQVYEELKGSFGIIFCIAHPNRKRALTYIFALMIRSIALAALTLYLQKYRIVQTACMTGLTGLFVAYFVFAKPFAKLIDNLFCFINEVTLATYLFVLNLLSWQNNHEDYTVGYILISLSLLIPTTAIVFGLLEPIKALYRYLLTFDLSSTFISVADKQEGPVQDLKNEEDSVVIIHHPTLKKSDSKVPFVDKDEDGKNPENKKIPAAVVVEKSNPLLAHLQRGFGQLKSDNHQEREKAYAAVPINIDDYNYDASCEGEVSNHYKQEGAVIDANNGEQQTPNLALQSAQTLLKTNFSPIPQQLNPIEPSAGFKIDKQMFLGEGMINEEEEKSLNMTEEMNDIEEDQGNKKHQIRDMVISNRRNRMAEVWKRFQRLPRRDFDVERRRKSIDYSVKDPLDYQKPITRSFSQPNLLEIEKPFFLLKGNDESREELTPGRICERSKRLSQI